MSLKKLSWYWRIVIGLIACIGIAFIAVEIWAVRTLEYAQRMVDDRDWLNARDALRTYLSLKPHDDVARMMLAKSLINDNSRPIVDVAQETLSTLAKIDNKSSEAVSARVTEGRVSLLLLLKPGRAEEYFIEALRLDPDRTEAHALLWKLYELTNRWFLIDPHFWSVYQHTEPSRRAYILRDWYMSEFAPASAVADLERQLGLLQPDQLPDAQTEFHRYEAFLTNEPDRAVNYACLVRWYQTHKITARISEYLNMGESLPAGPTDPFLIATHVGISLESGDLVDAENTFRHWPDSDHGYEYYKYRGIIEDQILHLDQAARESYERAIEFPAGRCDWQTCHRLSNVLMRLGATDEAAKRRQQSKETELLMEPDVHKPLRLALVKPNDPDSVEQMSEFYERLGRTRESQAWKELRALAPNSVQQP